MNLSDSKSGKQMRTQYDNHIDLHGKLQNAAARAQKFREDIQASRKSSETDDPFDVFVYDPLAIRLTSLFIKMKWSPNAVTLSSLVFGVAGAGFLYPQKVGLNLLGVALIIFAAVLDCSDGQVARLCHSGTPFGRVLDGAVDMLNYLAIYLTLGFRLMNEYVPLTATVTIHLSWYIWIVIVLAIACHAGQARKADYYRGLHLYFLNGSNNNYLARSKDLRKELAALPEGSSPLKRVYLKIYLLYTSIQEKGAKHTQHLLDRIDENGGVIPEWLAECYIDQSRKVIQITNTLGFNLRTYILFLLLLFGKEVFWFLFVCVVLEGLKYAMMLRYETVAGRICAEFFPGGSGRAADENGGGSSR